MVKSWSRQRRWCESHPPLSPPAVTSPDLSKNVFVLSWRLFFPPPLWTDEMWSTFAGRQHKDCILRVQGEDIAFFVCEWRMEIGDVSRLLSVWTNCSGATSQDDSFKGCAIFFSSLLPVVLWVGYYKHWKSDIIWIFKKKQQQKKTERDIFFVSSPSVSKASGNPSSTWCNVKSVLSDDIQTKWTHPSPCNCKRVAVEFFLLLLSLSLVCGLTAASSSWTVWSAVDY